MIAIGTTLFDLEGNFLFYDKNIVVDSLTDMNIEKRISKTKTLDGKVYIEDSGYSVGDTDIELTIKNPTKELYLKIRDVFKYHSFVNISSRGGNFLCVPHKIRLRGGNAVLLFSTKDEA